MNISLHIAWRYLRYNNKDASITTMIRICFAGIFIGTFALMLTLIITNGFEKVIHEKMRGINASVIMYKPGKKLDFKAITTTLDNEFGTLIAGAGCASIKQAIIDNNNSQSVLFLKGIDPASEIKTTSLKNKIIQGFENKTDLVTTLKPGHILIGYKTAEDYMLSVGQSITLYIPEPTSKRKIALHAKTLIVGGIFKIGLEDYDRNLAFIDITTLNQLYDQEGVDQITININQSPSAQASNKKYDAQQTSAWSQITTMVASYKTRLLALITGYDHETALIDRLKERFKGFTITSWQELYPDLVVSLKLEKYVMFLVIALITLVASMNMISLLFMHIGRKRRDIAIFKAMGMSASIIQSIFFIMGITITTTASLCGLLAAAVVGWMLEQYPFIQLPDVYFVSYLPAHMDLPIFAAVFIATFFIGMIATWLPVKRATTLCIPEVLRQD